MQKETAPFVSLACLLACAASLARPPAHAAQSSANPAAGPTVVYSALVAVPSTPAFSANLKPGGMAVDPAGNVYLAENVGWTKPIFGGHISGTAGLAIKVNAAGSPLPSRKPRPITEPRGPNGIDVNLVVRGRP